MIEFLKQLLAPVTKTPDDDYSRIYSESHFKSVIDRETERADRSGLIFSIIQFDFLHMVKAQKSIDFLVQVIAARMRVSDEAGWLSDSRLGMILYNTAYDSAMILVEEFRLMFQDTSVQPPEIEIFIYPDDAGNLAIKSSDSRDIERVSLSLDTWLIVNDGDSEKHFKNVKTRNISIQGLFLESDNVFEEGTTVDMNLFFPVNESVTIKHDKIIIKTSGQVVRSENGGMGIKFDKKLSILPE